MKEEKERNLDDIFNDEGYAGNIWGWKWSWISLIVILVFISIAVCRYVVIKPDRLVHPEKVEEFG